MLGFAMKAGKIALGTDLVISSMKAKGDKKAKLILLSSDVSERTELRIGFKAEYFETPLRKIDVASDILADALGKSCKSVAVAILDERFAEEILKAIEQS